MGQKLCKQDGDKDIMKMSLPQARRKNNNLHIVEDHVFYSENVLKSSDKFFSENSHSTPKKKSNKIKIFVKTPSGEKKSYMVDQYDSVFSVKSKIEIDEGIPIKSQCLFLNQDEIYDKMTISGSKIKRNCVIQLQKRQPRDYKVIIENDEGQVLMIFRADPQDTVYSLFKRIKEVYYYLEITHMRLSFYRDDYLIKMDNHCSISDYNFYQKEINLILSFEQIVQ